MALHTIHIHSVNVTFDKDATARQNTENGQRCECCHCLNYYENIRQNRELVSFLADFGIDYRTADEVFSYKVGSLIHSEAFYGVEGSIEKEFDFEEYGVRISFKKPQNNTDTYFWITVESDFPIVAA